MTKEEVLREVLERIDGVASPPDSYYYAKAEARIRGYARAIDRVVRVIQDMLEESKDEQP